MILRIEVYNATGKMLGIVPNVSGASITRTLDGVGSVNIDAFATDERAVDLLQNERRVRIYVEENMKLREVGRGIIRNCKTSIGSGYSFNIDGVDAMDELKRINTLINRRYEDARTSEVCTSLAGLAGWGVEIEPALEREYVDARFDGSSVLKALQTLAEEQGFHLRLSNDQAGLLEIGYFGQQVPIRIINAETLPNEAYSNPNIAFIESMSISEDSEAVANRIFVFGAGQNLDAALTLEHSTRSNPYEIKWLYGPDNRKLYYIEDEHSIERYGVIERIVTFKEIAPLANNDASIHRAANMLYDAAKVWLRRNSIEYKSYSIALKKCDYTLRAGDRVRVLFRGVVDKEGRPYTWRAFDNVLWVVKVTENIGTEGKTTRVEVANIDKHQQSAARIVVGTLEQVQVQGINPQPSFNKTAYGPYRKEIDPDHDVTIPLTISDATYRLELCRLRIKTTPFRATAAGAAAADIPVVTTSENGQHQHQMLFHTSDTPAGGTTTRQYAASDGGAGFINLNLPTTTSGDMWTAGETSDHTHDVTIPAHTHELTYGIRDDDQYPGKVKITVDGQLVAQDLGSDDEGIEQEFDITNILNANLRSTHRIEITCAEGQGVVEVEAEIFDMILPIKLG